MRKKKKEKIVENSYAVFFGLMVINMCLAMKKTVMKIIIKSLKQTTYVT